jgi:flagellar biogenesis protein FliO
MMRWATICVLSLWGTTVLAAPEAIEVEKGRVSIPLAKPTTNKGMWAQGRTLIVVVPPLSLPDQSRRVHADPILEKVALRSRSAWSEIHLSLNKPAEAVLRHVRISYAKQRLTIQLLPAAVQQPALAAQEVSPEFNAAPPTKKAENKVDEQAENKDQKRRAEENPRAKSGVGSTAGEGGPWAALAGVGASALVGVALAVFWWWRRRDHGLQAQLAESRVKVIAKQSIARRQRIVLVDSCGDLLLLGCTNQDVKLLHTIKQTDTAKQSQARAEADFFAQGDQLDEEHRLSGSLIREPSFYHVAGMPSQALDDDSLTAAADDLPLDEQWAEGILRLRQARRQQGGERRALH